MTRKVKAAPATPGNVAPLVPARADTVYRFVLALLMLAAFCYQQLA